MPASLREALESALAADPDERSAHMAYADYLAEQDDPRGELIQVQLALEEEALPAEQRKRLQAREEELLATHQRQWLGPLAEHLLGEVAQEHPVGFRFARGWLTTLHASVLTFDLARALGSAGEARLLRELNIDSTAYDEPEDPAEVELYARSYPRPLRP